MESTVAKKFADSNLSRCVILNSEASNQTSNESCAEKPLVVVPGKSNTAEENDDIGRSSKRRQLQRRLPDSSPSSNQCTTLDNKAIKRKSNDFSAGNESRVVKQLEVVPEISNAAGENNDVGSVSKKRKLRRPMRIVDSSPSSNSDLSSVSNSDRSRCKDLRSRCRSSNSRSDSRLPKEPRSRSRSVRPLRWSRTRSRTISEQRSVRSGGSGFQSSNPASGRSRSHSRQSDPSILRSNSSPHSRLSPRRRSRSNSNTRYKKAKDVQSQSSHWNRPQHSSRSNTSTYKKAKDVQSKTCHTSIGNHRDNKSRSNIVRNLQYQPKSGQSSRRHRTSISRSRLSGHRSDRNSHRDRSHSISSQSSTHQLPNGRERTSDKQKGNHKSGSKSNFNVNYNDGRASTFEIGSGRNSHNLDLDLTTSRTTSSSDASVKELTASVKELTKAVRNCNDQMAKNDRRLNRLEVTVNKIFITVGDMNGNNRLDDGLDTEFDSPDLPICSKTELHIVHRKLKDKEFRRLWLTQERNFCCPTKTSTDCVTITKYLKRFVSLDVRCQLTLVERGERTLYKDFNRVYSFLIDVMKEGYRICGRKITQDDAHTALRVVWGRSKQLSDQK